MYRRPCDYHKALGTMWVLVEPLAVGLAAAERAALHPGALIAVIGAGPVNLLSRSGAVSSAPDTL